MLRSPNFSSSLPRRRESRFFRIALGVSGIPAFAGMTALVGCFGLILMLLITPALAVQPDEILKDPALEVRAREISVGLRCLVCQNQSIDDSDASVARDLRILIREQLQQNKSNQEVVDYVVDRYGDYVLLKPRLTGHTAVLWFAPFLILLICAFALLRRKKSLALAEQGLSDAEIASLDAILRK